MKRTTIFFRQINKSNKNLVGGKSLPLSVLIKRGFPIPDGFAVKSSLYRDLIKKYNLEYKINKILQDIDFKNNQRIEKASIKIRNLIEKMDIVDDIRNDIINGFNELGSKFVSVRSSATSEDSKFYSWAGEFETYTFVNKNDLFDKIKKCWSSLYTPRALIYANKNKIRYAENISVIVQKMINSEVSGVCFTKDPDLNNEKTILIEAVFGLGELLVHGDVIPDRYWVERGDLVISDVLVSSQKKFYTANQDGKVILKNIKTERQLNQKIDGMKIIEIAKIAKNIEKVMKSPQDIEWSICDNNIYILQSRPITASY